MEGGVQPENCWLGGYHIPFQLHGKRKENILKLLITALFLVFCTSVVARELTDLETETLEARLMGFTLAVEENDIETVIRMLPPRVWKYLSEVLEPT